MRPDEFDKLYSNAFLAVFIYHFNYDQHICRGTINYYATIKQLRLDTSIAMTSILRKMVIAGRKKSVF